MKGVVPNLKNNVQKAKKFKKIKEKFWYKCLAKVELKSISIHLSSHSPKFIYIQVYGYFVKKKNQ